MYSLLYRKRRTLSNIAFDSIEILRPHSALRSILKGRSNYLKFEHLLTAVILGTTWSLPVIAIHDLMKIIRALEKVLPESIPTIIVFRLDFTTPKVFSIRLSLSIIW